LKPQIWLQVKNSQIVNNDNGERFETYVIEGERGSGIICLNGAAARKVQVGDTLIVISYMLVEKEKAREVKPILLFPNEQNKLVEDSIPA
jgi:Aspartate 1-decarboxylase